MRTHASRAAILAVVAAWVLLGCSLADRTTDAGPRDAGDKAATDGGRACPEGHVECYGECCAPTQTCDVGGCLDPPEQWRTDAGVPGDRASECNPRPPTSPPSDEVEVSNLCALERVTYRSPGRRVRGPCFIDRCDNGVAIVPISPLTFSCESGPQGYVEPEEALRTHLYYDGDEYQAWSVIGGDESATCMIDKKSGSGLPELAADAVSNPFRGDNCVPDPLGGVSCCEDLDYCHDEGCTDGLHSCATYDEFGNVMTMSHANDIDGSAEYVANYDCWCPPEPFVGPCDTDHGGCDPLVTCKPDGELPKCGPCPEGYDDVRGDGTRCKDFDECARNNGGCEETCWNYDGEYRCDCEFGATLRDDGRTCDRAPVDRLDMGTSDARSPAIAMNDAGNAVVVWYQSDGTQPVLWTNRYEVGVGWEGPMPVGTAEGYQPLAPSVVLDGPGNAIAIWTQDVGGQRNLMSSRYRPATGWNTPSIVGAHAVSYSFAGGSNGDAAVVWSDGEGSSPGSIWANRYVAGTGWSGETALEGDANSAQSPAVAMDDAGNALVVWRQADASPATWSTPRSIWARHYVVGVGWGSSAPIEARTESADTPIVAMDATGDAVAVWEQRLNGRLWSNRYSTGGAWGISASLTDIGYRPGIAAAGSGTFIGAWAEGGRTLSSRNVAGVGWEAATPIDDGPEGGSHIEDDESCEAPPRIATNGAGHAMAVWVRYDDWTASIWANRYAMGTGWDVARRVETEYWWDACSPAVAIDDAGNAIAVWQQRGSIWANRLEAK